MVRDERLWSYVGRALRRRCPRCGGPGIWRSWFAFRARCPTCHLELDRGESDHFYGAYLLNFVVAELLPAIAFVIALLVTWPSPPWTALTWGGGDPRRDGAALHVPLHEDGVAGAGPRVSPRHGLKKASASGYRPQATA